MGSNRPCDRVEAQPAETEGVELDQPPRPIQMLIRNRLYCFRSQWLPTALSFSGRGTWEASFLLFLCHRIRWQGVVFSIDVGGDRDFVWPDYRAFDVSDVLQFIMAFLVSLPCRCSTIGGVEADQRSF